jgi:tRNA/rRNA methyltransferase
VTNQDDKEALGRKIDQLSIVLVRPLSAEQVGYTARLMSSYGVERGALVAPSCDINSLEARRAASGQGAMRLATMQTYTRLKDAVKATKYVISVDALIEGKDEIRLLELVPVVAQSDIALVWFSEHEPRSDEEAALVTHNLHLPRAKSGMQLPTSHSVGICLARIFEGLETSE